ncbi:MAG TPA: NAD(P)H-binding protein [Pseudonocardiaceae bacterium]|nr:NAD(P)H-binding protein [Pseudonocardiaceae bacterium]
MRLAVFGGTGGTGTQVIRQALDRGHEVTALARTPEAVTINDPGLRIIRGDVLTAGSADPVVADADAVISALGIGFHRHATTVYSAGTANILAAMAKAGVRRLLVVSTSSLTVPSRRHLPEWLLTRLILHPLLKRPYADMATMETRIRQSTVDWTVVRAAGLTNAPAKDKYRTSTNGRLRNGWTISRADLAAYLLDHIKDPQSHQTTVELAY